MIFKTCKPTNISTYIYPYVLLTLKLLTTLMGFPGGSSGFFTTRLQCRRLGFGPWVRKIPWRREWLPTPVFLPGEFHGQRSLAG